MMVRIVKNASQRRSEIVEAARHLFQTKEYEKATLQDVMDRLGIAKGTIYHYFKSKEELLEAVVDDVVSRQLEAMEALVKKAKGNALQKMKLLIAAGKDATAASVLEHLHKKGNEAVHARLLAATLIKQAPLYAKLIQRGCEEGIFRTDTPLECAEFILTAVQFLTDLGIYPWTKEDLARRAKAFPKLLEQQLQAKPGSFKFMDSYWGI